MSWRKLPAADGAQIAVKHYPAAGRAPVVLIHGLAVSAEVWDMPDAVGEGYHYRSLATLLREAGYDVWLVNLRGHGALPNVSEPAPGQTDWCVDDFATCDVPTVIDHVCCETGRKPFVVASSMGALSLAAFALGARCDGAAGRIVLDDALGAARQAQLSGAVFVEMPAALRWPKSLYDESGSLRWQMLMGESDATAAASNMPFEFLSRAAWLEAIIASAGNVPLNWLRPGERESWWRSKLPPALAASIERAQVAAVGAALRVGGTFTGATGHRADVILRRRYVVNDMKAGVLRQLAKCVRRGAFVSAGDECEVVYSEHYAALRVPTLVLAGGRDRIANPGVVREVFFDRLGSADRQFELFDEIGHGEFTAAPVSTERVYPRVLLWLDARDGGR